MKKSLITTVILIGYSLILIKVMVFKDVPTIRVGALMLNFGGTDASGPANFLPFKTILPYLLGDKGYIIAGINLVGNIGLLVPVGFVAACGYRNMTWKKALTLAVAAGLTIEILQTVLRVGIFDIDDVILNALGVMLGYWTFVILAKWVRSRKYLNIVFSAIMVIGVAAAAFYAVYPKDEQLRGVGAGDVRFNNAEGEVPRSGDLCNGTKGTGQIVRVGNNTLTIRRNDGVNQTINLTARTTIRSSAGAISEADLKPGDRVTLVVYESDTATAVLVCNLAGLEIQKGR